MANGLYDTGREAFLKGDIAWDTDDIRCVLVDADDYVVNLSTHDFLDDIPAGARVSVSGSFTGKTTTAGVADADDVTLTSVSGDESEAVVIYKHTGTDSTSQLIAYLDTGTGLAITPTGTNITIVWSEGANKIFKL